MKLMKHYVWFALIVVLLLTAGCVWTGPGPTLTPRPTRTPLPATATPAQAAAPTSVPAAMPTLPAVPMPANPAERNQMFQSPPPMVIDLTKRYTATIKTARGDIVCELYPGRAPQTVNNLVYLARAGFYNGLTFHRVEPGFVIQGGDPLGQGSGGPGYTLPAEIGLSHTQGALAMARLADQVNPQRESSGSQFYITLAATPNLDGAYTVFGQVVQGFEVVQAIQRGDVIQEIVIQESADGR